MTVWTSRNGRLFDVHKLGGCCSCMPRWPGGVAVRSQAGSRTRPRPTPRARAQVAYARWLVTWGMELEDKKLRPSGSPPRDGVLADLAHQLCAFPAHAPDCKFATFYRRAPAQRAHPIMHPGWAPFALSPKNVVGTGGVHPLVHLFDNCQEASARSAGTSQAADLPRATLRTSKRARAVLLRVARLCARRCGVILATTPRALLTPGARPDRAARSWRRSRRRRRAARCTWSSWTARPRAARMRR